MVNPRLAGRYAKSLIDLAVEQGNIESVYKDVLYLDDILSKSPELVTVLRSPVIPGESKQKVLDALTNGKIGEITASFNRLLIKKGRENYIADIIESFIAQYKEQKGIHIVTLTTAVPISDSVKDAIVSKLKEVSEMKLVELKTLVEAKIIGGFILEADGRRVDASIAYDLAVIKKQFSNNDFIFRIR